MLKKAIIGLIVLVGTSFISCHEDSLKELNHTIQDKLISEVNKEVPIKKLTKSSDSYTILFSDDVSLSIKQDEIPLVTIGSNYNWYINDIDTGIASANIDGFNPVFDVNSNGNWYINGVDSGIKTKVSNWKNSPYIKIIAQFGNKLLFYFSDKTVPVDVVFTNLKNGIFGVKIDRSTPNVNKIERIYDSVGLEPFVQVEGLDSERQDDFVNVFPYSDMKVCNVDASLLGGLKIIYENEIGFSRDTDTFVEIPLFYMKRYIEGSYDYRLISRVPQDDFFPAPMFIEGDKILDKVYVGVYQTSIDGGGKARSVTGKFPANGLTQSDFRNLHYAKGIGFSTVDVRTIMSLQHLFLIRFANKNSQECIGGGWTDLAQPIISTISNRPTNRIVIRSSVIDVPKHWFVGQNVCTVLGDIIKEHAVLKEILYNTPLKGQTTFVVDRTLNLDGHVTFGAAPQNTGWSDVLTHDTGRTKQNIKDANDQACSVKLFGIEDLWGNTWLMLDGLFFKGTTPYLSFDSKNNGNYDSYVATNFQCIEQSQNHPYSGTFGFVENIGIDATYPWLSFPDAIGTNNVNGSRGYGDFFYQYNDMTNNRYCVFGGGFDNYDRCGMFSFRNWNHISLKWYLYGTRMQYKAI